MAKVNSNSKKDVVVDQSVLENEQPAEVIIMQSNEQPHQEEPVLIIRQEEEEQKVLLVEPVIHHARTIHSDVVTVELSDRVLLTSNLTNTKTLLQETQDSINSAKNKPSMAWWYGR